MLQNHEHVIAPMLCILKFETCVLDDNVSGMGFNEMTSKFP